MSSYALVSSDSHIIEPHDLWTSRIDRQYLDRAPFLAHEETTDQWYVDGIAIGSIGSVTQAGERFEHPENITFGGRYADVRPGGLDPHARIKDLEADTVAGDVMYPTIAMFLYNVLEDSLLLSATLRAYNDWLAEYCQHYPDRTKGIAMINVDDIEDAVSEIQRSAKMGLVGAMIPQLPQGRQYDHPDYDPFWAAAQDLDMPLSLHVTTARGLKLSQTASAVPFSTPQMDLAIGLTNRDVPVRNSLQAMIFSGVFERYPKLQAGAVEYEVSWAPNFILQMDRVYKETAVGFTQQRFKGELLPSDFFHRNVFVAFQEDELGIQMSSVVGVDNLMWGSDYPHSEGTFPKSREIVDRILRDVPEQDKVKIAGGNTARLYHFDGL